MPWFVKIEKGVVEKATFDQFVPAHRDYVRRLIQQGHQAKTGYWQDRGGGMMLFQAANLQEAEAIMAQDPLIQSGCVDYQLHEWCLVVE
jgi:uncharacterized protein YciI